MLSHVDKDNQPAMVYIGEKLVSYRIATAQAIVLVPANIGELFDGNDIQSKKGPVFSTAIVAGTMAVKRCWELIPFCHPLPIDGCKIQIKVLDRKTIQILCTVETAHKTGVEMEALCGANITALTIYDMCKAMSPEIVIAETKLLKKMGGKQDYEFQEK